MQTFIQFFFVFFSSLEVLLLLVVPELQVIHSSPFCPVHPGTTHKISHVLSFTLSVDSNTLNVFIFHKQGSDF